MVPCEQRLLSFDMYHVWRKKGEKRRPEIHLRSQATDNESLVFLFRGLFLNESMLLNWARPFSLEPIDHVEPTDRTEFRRGKPSEHAYLLFRLHRWLSVAVVGVTSRMILQLPPDFNTNQVLAALGHKEHALA